MGRAGPVAPRTTVAGFGRTERTGLVALGVPSLAEPYFAELSSRFIAAAGQRGLSIVLSETQSDRSREIDLVNGVGLPAVDGLIHVPRALRVADLTRRVAPGPLVLIGEPAPSSPFSHVTIDNAAAGRMATEHLLDLGCRSVAMIGPREDLPSVAADRRFEGYCDALRARGRSIDAELVAPVTEFSPEEGVRAMHALLASARPPDGVVCSSDSIGLGVLSALAARGHGPQVRVVGIDDIQQARFTAPGLSSVRPDKDALVQESIRLLMAQIEAPPASNYPVEQVEVGISLVRRDSSA